MITRTSRLATGTLLTILSIVPMYGCSRQPKSEEPQPCTANSLEVLKQENEELKLQAENLELKKRIQDSAKTDTKKCGENYKLKEANARLGESNAEYLLEINQQRREISELELKIDCFREEIRGCFANSELNQDYPLKNFQQVLERAEASYDKEKIKKAWEGYNSEEKEVFYMAFLDKDLFYQSFSPAKKERYEEFYRKGLATEEIKRIEATTGMTGLDKYKSPLSLIVFQVREAFGAKIFVPAVR